MTIETRQLSVRDGALVSVSTFGDGNAGALQVHAGESVQVVGKSINNQFQSELTAAVTLDSTGKGGSLTIETGQLSVKDAILSSRSEGQKSAGNIDINVRGSLQANNSYISTSSTQAGGGNISVNAKDIRLFDNSDITTNVFTGTGGGGKITLTANSIIALNDSDILAFARDGRGGDITLNTPAFFGENYRPASTGIAPRTLDGNNRVDLNATGAIASGNISIPDNSFVENSLIELPQNPIDTNALIASSCIARGNKLEGSFIITGAGGLPNRPGDVSISTYPTGTVRSVERPWQKGDPIVEPLGVYRLPSGKLVLSRECSS